MISVCIATYNGEKFVKEQLRSIAAQLHADDEIIVSDDNSTDHTLKEIADLQIPQVKIFKNKERFGYTKNFENALKHASGDVIFLSDQDDVWCSNKVKVCIDALKQASLVATDAKIVDVSGRVLATSFFELRRPYRTLIGNIVKFGYLGCCLCFRREVLEKALPFPPNSHLCTHDNWLFLVAQFFYSTKIIDKPLLEYRRHGANVSGGGINGTASFWFRIRYRFYLLYHLLLRSTRK